VRVLLSLVLLLTGCAVTPASIAPTLLDYAVMLTTKEGQGFCAGVAITRTQVLTAAHCILDDMNIRLQGGDPIPAKVVWRHETRDLAVLEAPGAVLTPARLGGEGLRVGERVYAVGAPYGVLEFSFAVGYVGHLDRAIEEEPGRFIQLYIESRGGNSGGPIFNDAGEVVAVLVRSDRTGLTFAVPAVEVTWRPEMTVEIIGA
jgi:S1-C subfamily serine protease